MKTSEFLQHVDKYVLINNHIRRGQAAYNVASQLFGEKNIIPVAGSLDDPFYNDNVLPSFLHWLRKNSLLELDTSSEPM